ncbi:hypothetical protein [Dictyobacter kobayashii]|uniref:Uncharacterized protein n=1 Tax=Dictyobacter kobayashii TaxID=2014872 RepID=A0A402AYA1_9CHLR|nr:hypothetical protein [Dictyobacter kobayashii]GCE24054.1 hypothetical protein KDK_78540 [Dictyobacter kobayashii]
MFEHRVARGLRDKQPRGEETGPPYRGGKRGQASHLQGRTSTIRSYFYLVAQ